jgi:hypothetical protein
VRRNRGYQGASPFTLEEKMYTSTQHEPKDRRQFGGRQTGPHFSHKEPGGAEDGCTSCCKDREQRREMSVICLIRIDVRIERIVGMGSIKRECRFGCRHLQSLRVGWTDRKKRDSLFGGGEMLRLGFVVTGFACKHWPDAKWSENLSREQRVGAGGPQTVQLMVRA